MAYRRHRHRQRVGFPRVPSGPGARAIFISVLSSDLPMARAMAGGSAPAAATKAAKKRRRPTAWRGRG